jgi:hypothetical protein
VWDVPDSVLDEIAAELRDINQRASWSRTLATGEIVLKRFFRGDVDEWRTHRVQKEESIRRLARRPDCPLGRSALSEAVGVYVVSRELRISLDELTPSHVAVVLRVQPMQREKLLRRAIDERLTVRELRTEVLSLRRRDGERRGRPRLTLGRAAISDVRRSLDALQSARDRLESAREIDLETFESLDEALHVLEVEIGVTRERARSVVRTDRDGPTIGSGPRPKLVVPAPPVQAKLAAG